ncbi:MAG: TnsA endonuclease N-terminal domain-containing protein [Shewanella psychromarinicola]|jgi:hypothetical protein|uniref:TnsA endonuclease N-terminal domain-containing protein n=1 Tax=Shewanella psychromarinicola TaxID=2487742 RepID=UPI0030012C1C
MNKTKPRVHGGRFVHRCFSKKNNSAIVVESYLEKTFVHLFSCNPNVKSFGSQTESMHCDYDGKRCRYTPDFLVNYIDGSSAFIEVHPKVFVNDEYKRRIAHFNAYSLAESGIPILIMTDENLGRMVRVNYELIALQTLASLSVDIPTQELPAQLTFGELITLVSHYAVDGIAQAYTLLANRLYEFDMNKLLTASTEVTKAS